MVDFERKLLDRFDEHNRLLNELIIEVTRISLNLDLKMNNFPKFPDMSDTDERN